MRLNKRLELFCMMLPACLMIGGCGLDLEELFDELDLDDVAINIDRSVNVIQTEDPRNAPLPQQIVDRGDTIIIADNATIITDVSTQLVVEELPDITLLGLENITDFDVYLGYFVDDTFQSVLIFSGETLLIEYPCLSVIELVFEDDIDPFDGFVVDSFDLTGSEFINPFDFECGDAVIITIDPFAVDVSTEPFGAERIDLFP